MAVTNVNDLTDLGNIAIGDKLIGERVAGTTVQLTFDGVLTDSAFGGSNGLLARTAADTYTSRTITGTASRISVSDGDGVSGNPTIDIDAAYVGQASITTLGTISTGTWQGTAIAVDQGGTGDTTYTNGQLLIGNTTGNTLTKATLTGTADEIEITNGTGSITLNLASTYAGGSSIATVGTITSGTWQGTTIAVNQGGTGQTSYTDGQLLIGNSTGNTLAKATLTAGEGIDITNGSGTITILGEDASATNKGIVELATTAETTTGTDTGRAIPVSALPLQIQDSVYNYAADGEASDTYVITTGQLFHFKANTANTGACTLNVNGLGAKAIKTKHDQDPANNDIEAGQIVTVIYDGTNFQMQSQVASSAGAGDMVLASIQTNTGAKTFDSGTLIYAGATSGTTTVNATAVAGTTTLTLPAATDTLVGKATTDTFTNKTFDANGTGNSLSNVDVADLANGTDGELITWDSSGNPATVAVGSANEVLTSNGAGAAPTFQAVSSPSAATQAEQETGTATNVYVSPGRQQYHASACKSWLEYNHVTGTPTINSSFNVSSLTDTGAGKVGVNFTVAFSGTSYAMGGAANYDIGTSLLSMFWDSDEVQTAAKADIVTGDAATANADDPDRASVCFFGDQ
jgi:hypothetical protein